MANNELLMNANEVVAFLQKPSSEFTKEDIVRFIQENEIKMVNFMYPGGDGKLKTLNFIINNLAYLDTILTCGERVDGSSLFSFIQAGSSDLYVLPRFLVGFRRSLRRNSYALHACILFRQGRQSARKLARIHLPRLQRLSARLRAWNSMLWANWNIT